MQKSYKEDNVLPLYSILLYKNLAKVSSTFQHPRAKSRFQFFFRKKSNPDAVGLIPQRTQKGTSMLFFVLCFIVCLCFWLTNVKGGSIQSTALFFFKKLHHKEKNRKIYTTEYSRDLILREYTTAVPLCVKIIFKMSRYRSPKTCAWMQFYFIEITIVNMNMKCVKRIMFLFETRGLKALTAT